MTFDFSAMDEGRQFTAGSRNANGNVPNAYWNRDNGKVNVGSLHPENHDSVYGARRVVSFIFKISNPATEHLTDFLNFFLTFKVILGGYDLFVFRKTQEHFQYFDFSMSLS